MSTTTTLAPSTPKLLTPRIALVLAAQCLFGLGWSGYLVQPKFLASELHASPGVIARITFMSPLAAVLVIPFATTLMDRMSRVGIFRAGLGVLLLVSLGYLGVDQVTPLLYLLQAGIGASYVLSYNASASIIADEAPRERLGQAIGFLGASNVVTNAVATTLSEKLAHAFGWQAAFGASIVFVLLGLTVSLAIQDGGGAATRAGTGSLMAAIQGPLRRVLVAAALAGAAFSAMFTFHQPYALALGGKSVASFFVGFTAAAVAMRVLLGSLGDRYGHRRVSVAALLGYGAVVLATAWLDVDLLWVYGFGFGAAHGVLYPTLNALGVELAPEGMRGRVITVYGGAFNVGVAMATLAWGAVAETAGFPALFVIASIAGFAGAWVLGHTPTRPRSNRVV